MRGLKIVLAILLLSVAHVVCASGGYVHLTKDDGLHSNYITSIYRDPCGWVWIGTAEGLSCFDGAKIRKFDLVGSDSAQSVVRVNNIIDCGDGEILLATNKGLYDFLPEEDRFSVVACQDVAVYCAVSLEDYLLMGSDDGLVVKGKNGGDRVKLLSGEKVVAIESNGESVFVLTTSNLYSLHLPESDDMRAAFEFKSLSSAVKDEFSDMVIREGIVYVGTSHQGVGCYDLATPGVLKGLDGVQSEIVRSLSVAGDVLYVATDGNGVVKYDLAQHRRINESNDDVLGLTSRSITCVDVDSLGMMWVGSYSTGLFFTQAQDSFISQLPLSEGVSVRSMLKVGESRYVIGSRDGLVLMNGVEKQVFRNAENSAMKSDIILSLCHYKDNLYIAGTFGGGAFFVDEQQGRVMPFDLDSDLAATLDNESIYAIESVGDALYFFTLKGLVKYSQAGGVERWDSNNSDMPSSKIYSQCYDKHNNIFWIGTLKGLCRYDIDSGEIEKVALLGIENDFRTNVIELDTKGNLYFDREFIELFKITAQTLVPQRVDFAPNFTDHISGVVDGESDDMLWIATTNGLYSYNVSSEQSIKFAQTSGLKNANICPNSLMKLEGNKLLIGSENGLYTFNPRVDDGADRRNCIYLSSVKINGGEHKSSVLLRSKDVVDGQRQYVVKVDAGKLLEIEIVDPYFSRMQEFKYALCIGDGEWVYSDSNNFVIDKELSVGHYSIKIKVVREGDTHWGEPITIGHLIVKLDTVTLVLGGALLLLLILYAIFWRVIRKMIITKKRKQKPVEDVDEERLIQVLDILRKTLEEKHEFKNPTFRVKDMADSTGLSVNEISYALNKHLKINFSDFINDYRIEEVKKLLLEDDANYYMLHVLAERCGFNSKTSFYRIFKNKMGVTPLQYRKGLMGSKGSDETTPTCEK